MQDELALLARARTLDAEALTEIHQAYYSPIYRYVAMRVGNVKVVEDLTSEVFTRLLSALRDKTAPQRTLRGWLYKVAGHVVVDHYRRQGRATQVELTEMLPSKEESPEMLTERQLSAESLHEAIRDLTEEQQTVLALRFGSGMRIREVAQMVGKSEGAVKQLQLRAIAMLSNKLLPGMTDV